MALLVTFSTNTLQYITNAKKRIHIHEQTSSQHTCNTYKSLIETSLLYQSTVIYDHMKDREKTELHQIAQSAEKLCNTPLPNLKDTK